MEPNMKHLRDKAAIVGIGEIPFVLGDCGKSFWAMGLEACYKARELLIINNSQLIINY